MKRSVIKERHIELLVVADYSMFQWHTDQDIESYILTLITMVRHLLTVCLATVVMISTLYHQIWL